MAVAYVTEKANVNTLSYVFGKQMAPSFQKANIMMNLMYTENVPADTNVVRLEKSGYLVAEAHTESTAVSLSANGELTDSYATATAAAICVVSARSAHLRRFGGQKGSLPRFLAEQGKAIAHYVDDDALTAAGAGSHSVTSTTTLTFEDLASGQYTILAHDIPDQDTPLAFVGAAKGFKELGVQAIQSGAAAYANDAMLGIFKSTGGRPQANGYRGEIFPGIQGWMSSGFTTGSSDNYQLLLHPKWALFGIFDDGIIVKNVERVEEGFYDSIGSLFFYDVGIYHEDCLCVMKSDS